jgi:hypothetical protein
MNKQIKNSNGIKTKPFIIIRIIFILCSLGSLTGFPWAFLPWDTVAGMTNSKGEILIDSSLQTIFLFRIQCLFFGAFSGFYLFMAYQPVRYKNLIFISSLLMLLMSVAMVYVRNISGLYTSLTAYEHYIWLVIGIAMFLSWFFELRKYSNNHTEKQYSKYTLRKILKLLGIILFANTFWVIMPQNLIEATMKLLKLPSYFGNPYSEYAAGLIFFFLGILGITLFVCAMKPEQYKPILKFIASYTMLTFICLIVWMFEHAKWNIFTILVSLLCVIIGISILIFICKNSKQKAHEHV